MGKQNTTSNQANVICNNNFDISFQDFEKINLTFREEAI